MRKQKCNSCNKIKPVEEFYFRKDRNAYKKVCKECVRSNQVKYKKKKIQGIIDNGGHNYDEIYKKRKKCPKCEKIKSCRLFYKVFENYDGLAVYCKSCEQRYSQDRIYRNRNFCYTDEELNTKKKLCKDCKKEKLISEFGRSSRNNDGLKAICKNCSNIKMQAKRNTKIGKYKDYRHTASRRNILWQLTKEDFERLWQQPCFYCGGPIATIGIDRVDNSIGYMNSNIVSCCYKCNIMKNKFSLSDFRKHVEKIYKVFNTEE